MKLNYFLLFALFAIIGCIENDIPYPIRKGLITEIEFGGQKSVEIDNENYIVNLVLDETTDIQNVEVVKLVASENTTVTPAFDALPLTLNLQEDFHWTLSTYQEYHWTIKATQPVTRTASVNGQIGKAIFDERTHQVIIYVSKEIDVESIQVNNITFASPLNSTVFPNPIDVSDFREPVVFTVTQFDRTTAWTVHVLPSPVSIITGDPEEVWATKAILTGSIEVREGVEVGFEYKSPGETEFQRITDVTIDGGGISATIATEPSTTYYYRVFQGKETGADKSLTTEGTPTIPNLGFDDWYKNGKTWFPCLESEYGKPANYRGFWNTGNIGVTLFKESNVYPTNDAVSGKAAYLETIGSVPLVGLAAGSLFVGNFDTDLGNPLNSTKFGRPFTGRPIAIKGMYKYFPQKITVSDESKTPEMIQYKGQNDRCIMWVNLEDWKGATQRPKNPTIIARGEFRELSTVNEYKEFLLTLDYKDRKAKPTHLCLVFSASEFGDFYTGGIGTKLFIDDLEIIY